MSTSIVAFHRLIANGVRPTLLLERHGSLATDDLRRIAREHGFDIALGEGARERLPMREEAG
jgi:hypothetical protein